MKIVDGAWNRASSNRTCLSHDQSRDPHHRRKLDPFLLTLTSFSESPLHLLTMVDAEMLKKVVLHSVATALASRVLPVPQN